MRLLSTPWCLALLLPAVGCSSSDAGSGSGISTRSDGSCAGLGCQVSSSDAKDSYDLVVPGAAVAGGNAGGASANATAIARSCGLAAIGCSPDDAESCAHAVAGASGGSTSQAKAGLSDSGGSTATDGSAVSVGGIGSESTIDVVVAGATTGIGTTVSTSGGGSGALACRIILDNTTTRSQCEVAGVGVEGASCNSRIDCAAGFACTNNNGKGECLHYCCGGNAACTTGSYCGEREAYEGDGSTVKMTVAVCLKGVSCRFNEPFPCPANQVCSCPANETCGVVRSDGTTACVVPGTGVEGESCPCSVGYVCSDALRTCIKTCSLVDSAKNVVQCPNGACQSSPSLPSDVGICVSSATLN